MGRDDHDARGEQLRAGFQRQGAPGLAEDAARKERQTRRVSMVVAGLLTVLGLVLIIVRLTRGREVGAWTACYAAGTVLAGLGGVLSRRGSTRLAIVASGMGAALLAAGDATAGRL